MKVEADRVRQEAEMVVRKVKESLEELCLKREEMDRVERE